MEIINEIKLYDILEIWKLKDLRKDKEDEKCISVILKVK